MQPDEALIEHVLERLAGQDDAFRQRLFDRFFRVDKSRSHPESDGAGLGLSITQAIMAAHGGAVTARSSHGRTTFCLVFAGSHPDRAPV